jgi:hypothetical protein
MGSGAPPGAPGAALERGDHLLGVPEAGQDRKPDVGVLLLGSVPRAQRGAVVVAGLGLFLSPLVGVADADEANFVW